jgi:hypothetical protein
MMSERETAAFVVYIHQINYSITHASMHVRNVKPTNSLPILPCHGATLGSPKETIKQNANTTISSSLSQSHGPSKQTTIRNTDPNIRSWTSQPSFTHCKMVPHPSNTWINHMPPFDSPIQTGEDLTRTCTAQLQLDLVTDICSILHWSLSKKYPSLVHVF